MSFAYPFSILNGSEYPISCPLTVKNENLGGSESIGCCFRPITNDLLRLIKKITVYEITFFFLFNPLRRL